MEGWYCERTESIAITNLGPPATDKMDLVLWYRRDPRIPLAD